MLLLSTCYALICCYFLIVSRCCSCFPPIMSLPLLASAWCRRLVCFSGPASGFARRVVAVEGPTVGVHPLVPAVRAVHWGAFALLLHFLHPRLRRRWRRFVVAACVSFPWLMCCRALRPLSASTLHCTPASLCPRCQNRVSTERLHVVGEAYAVQLMAPLADTVARHRSRYGSAATDEAYVPPSGGAATAPEGTESVQALGVQAGLRYIVSTLARCARVSLCSRV